MFNSLINTQASQEAGSEHQSCSHTTNMAKLCLLFVIFSIVTPFIYATFGGYGKVEQSDDKAIDNEYVTREEVDMGEVMVEELPVL